MKAWSYTHSSKRKTLTKAEIVHEHNRCCEAFVASGIDPYLKRTVYENGLKKKKRRRVTETHDTGPSQFSYDLTKNWVSLPLADHRRSQKIAKQLLRVCWGADDLWMGMVTAGKPCPVLDVGSRQRQLMTRVARFFNEQCRFHKVRHIFSVAHTSVRDRETEVLRKNSYGALLYHVHVHFLFFPARNDKSRQRFAARFKSRFGNGCGLEEVDTPHAAITYLTAVQSRSDLIHAGEFVDWHYEVAGAPRLRIYGEFRAAKKRSWTTPRKNGRSGPLIDKKNRFSGKRWYRHRRFTAWENLVDAPSVVYEKEGVAREADRVPY